MSSPIQDGLFYGQVAVSRRARDRGVAERLWEASEEKTGVSYPALDPA